MIYCSAADVTQDKGNVLVVALRFYVTFLLCHVSRYSSSCSVSTNYPNFLFCLATIHNRNLLGAV